jgi:7-cyano-7-deazaguanine synthase
MKSKIVITLSGGADSAVLLYKAAKEFDEVYTVTFNYGQRHQRELEAASKQLQDVKKIFPNVSFFNKVLSVPFISEIAPTSSLTSNLIATPSIKDVIGDAQPKSYVPYRNLMFLSILSSYAESINAAEIWYGAAEADSLAGYWDASAEFVQQINKLTELNRKNVIKINAPLIKLSKKEIISLGISLGVNFANTYTCYSGEYPCDAESASSSLRLKGFVDNRYIDPLEYKQQDSLNTLYKTLNCKLIKNAFYPESIKLHFIT